MSRGPDGVVITTSGFPRVSGDEPLLAPLPLLMNRFSPRERG